MRVSRSISFAALFTAAIGSAPAAAQELPVHLRDRGTGVAMSQFGTYAKKGELLVYPFFEWYYDPDLEYKPNDLGYVGGQDCRGKYEASEGLLFLGYGVTQNLALELEAAVISAGSRNQRTTCRACRRW